jgi:formylglycine-generating enzyme
MSELVISYYPADEPLITPILARLCELGVEAVATPIDRVTPAAFEQARNGLILLCWSPGLVGSGQTTDGVLPSVAAGKVISCLIAPCQFPAAIDTDPIDSLIGWQGGADAAAWLALVSRIAVALQRPGLIELSRAFATGIEQDRHAFAKRYPDEPVAKDIWRQRETKYRQAFEHSLAFARANFDRRVRNDWRKIEDMLKVYKTEFEIWLEDERLGNSRALPQPHFLTADDFNEQDSAREAETKAGALADQLAREYSRRRELSDRAARLELQLQQSEAEATLKLQMASRAMEAAYKHAQTAEREHAAIVVERNILNHGQAALRSELERARNSPRRRRIVASVVIATAVIGGGLARQLWSNMPTELVRADITASIPEFTGTSSTASRKGITPGVTKETVGPFLNEALKVAPGAVVTALLRVNRSDVFANVPDEDLSALASRLMKIAPRAALIEMIRAEPQEVVDSTLQSFPDILIPTVVRAMPEAVLQQLAHDNEGALIKQVTTGFPAAAAAELTRTNPAALAAALVKSQPEALLSEMLQAEPDAMVQRTVQLYPNASAAQLLKGDADQFVSEITKLLPDKLLTELLRVNQNRVIGAIVRDFPSAVAAEMLRSDPNSLVSSALKLDPSRLIGDAARLAPETVVAEALRSNLSSVTLQAIKMAPPSLIVELVKARPAELASAMAKTYPGAVTAELLKYSSETVMAEVLKAKPSVLTAKPAAEASTALRASTSGLISTDQSTVTTEEIGQVPLEAVRNIVSRAAKLAVLSTAAPAAPKNAEKEIIQDCELCPRLAAIPAGTSFIGLRGEEKLSSDIVDRSAHGRVVTIAAPFALSESKITVGQFKAFMLERHKLETSADTCRSFGGRAQRNAKLNYLSPGFEQEDAHPVVCVSWRDAVEYAQWLSEKTGKHYRLPTEAEWEYSARATSHDEWRGADNPSEGCRFGNILDASAFAKRAVSDRSQAASCSDQWVYTSPPGAFAANGFGLFDMYGNAHEWVQDCWNDDLSSLPGDGSARNGETDSAQCTSEMRVRRGSAWTTPPAASGLAARWKGTESHAFQDTGFRVLREGN